MSTRRWLSEQTARSAQRWAVVVLLLSVTVLQRFGLGSAEFSLSPALIAMFLLLAVAALGGGLILSTTRAVLYAAVVGVALTSAMLNDNRASLPSFLLLTVMYLPFVFVLEPGALDRSDADWVMRQFLKLSFVCAIFGIVQFFLQFAIHSEWLFDFSSFIPSFLRASGTYNTVIPVGTFNKSNGFFFREPSSFSLLMAVALIAESVLRKRPFHVACYALALLLTYSGTGIAALLIGASLPLGRKTVLRLGTIACVGGLVFALFDDSLNLSFTLGRISEFGSDRSSAYMRYIAPGRLLGDLFFSDPWSAWVGHGPGTMFRTIRQYEFHDPTWAKLLFEYGALGFLLVLALFISTLRRPGIPIQLRATLFAAWLMLGGHLLSPEQNYLTLMLIGLLPVGARLSSNRECGDDENSFSESSTAEYGGQLRRDFGEGSEVHGH